MPVPSMPLAERINAWLTPERRQAIYRTILTLGVLATAISPTLSTQVAQWTNLVVAVGTVGSLILAGIVTKAPQWPRIYAGMSALVVALVGASLITASAGDMAVRILEAVLTVAPLLMILARTDTSTPDGSPLTEVAARRAAESVTLATVTALPSTTAGGDVIVHEPGDGGPSTTSPLG